MDFQPIVAYMFYIHSYFVLDPVQRKKGKCSDFRKYWKRQQELIFSLAQYTFIKTAERTIHPMSNNKTNFTLILKLYCEKETVFKASCSRRSSFSACSSSSWRNQCRFSAGHHRTSDSHSHNYCSELLCLSITTDQPGNAGLSTPANI